MGGSRSERSRSLPGSGLTDAARCPVYRPDPGLEDRCSEQTAVVDHQGDENHHRNDEEGESELAGVERALYELKTSARVDVGRVIIFVTDGIIDTRADVTVSGANAAGTIWGIDLFNGTRQELRVTRQGKDLVSIPIPQIDIPKLRFGDKQQGGVAQGDGDPGDALSGSPQEGEGGEGQAGDQAGDHALEVELTLDELADILGEELELPNIENKGKSAIIDKKDRYVGVRNVGPNSLRHFKRTFRSALRRQIALGSYDPKRPVIIPTRDDMRYKSWKTEEEPVANAVILYMMDVSGSMGWGYGDDYTPGGVNNRRPDRAVLVYANLIRNKFKNTCPIVLGGIEASLRRIAHFDYWQEKIRRSVLLDAKAENKLESSMAKVKANSVYHEVCHHGVVLHGAIGWTEEMDIGLYHIKTKAVQFDGGMSDLHLERIAAELETYVPEYKKLYP